MKTLTQVCALLCSMSVAACAGAHKIIYEPSQRQIEDAVVVGQPFAFYTHAIAGAKSSQLRKVVVASKDAQGFSATSGEQFDYSEVKSYWTQESGAEGFGGGVRSVLLAPFAFICLASGICSAR